MKRANKLKWLPMMLWCLPILLIFSCKKEADHANKDKAEIRVSVSGAKFDQTVGTKGNFAKANGIQNSLMRAQYQRIPLNKDLVLKAELKPIESDELPAEISSVKASKKASTEADVGTGVKYKVMVYNDAGIYLTERAYVRGSESSTEALMLDNGNSYTFIAYSINSSAENAEPSFSDPANKTLSGTSISTLDGDADFMYFRKDMTVSSDGDNYLNIIFAHKFSQILTTIDASATQETIAEVEASFDSHYPNADIQLADAAISRPGATETLPITFTGINTAVISANSIVNGNTSSGSLTISKLTIGSLTRTDLPPITNLSISPGVSYKLNLTVEPQDRALFYLGQFSTRIGGRIWMSHNLGADTTLDPDTDPTVRALLGNYYQFGRPNMAATANTGNGAVSGWNTNQAADGSWNSGTESNPTKTANDPCPNGFRIPTRQEFEDLINSSNTSNIGTWTSNSTANTIGAAKVMTSKNNPSAKLTFPATGYRNASNGTLYWRGGSGLYWTISVAGSNLTRFTITQNSVAISTGNSNQPNNLAKTSGFSVRCISER